MPLTSRLGGSIRVRVRTGADSVAFWWATGIFLFGTVLAALVLRSGGREQPTELGMCVPELQAEAA